MKNRKNSRKKKNLLSPEKRERKAHFNKRTVLRFKMRNLSFLSQNPDRRLVKVEEDKGSYFPPHILQVKDPVARENLMNAYSELESGLKLQRKYKHNCQAEPSLLKLSKELGLFPKRTTTDDPEVALWEERMEERRRKKAERSLNAKMAHRRKKTQKTSRLTYAQQLAQQLQKDFGIAPPKPRGRKPKKVRVVFIHRQRDDKEPDYKLVAS